MAGSKCEKRKSVTFAGRSSKGQLDRSAAGRVLIRRQILLTASEDKIAEVRESHCLLYLLPAAGQFLTSLWSLKAKKSVVKVLNNILFYTLFS